MDPYSRISKRKTVILVVTNLFTQERYDFATEAARGWLMLTILWTKFSSYCSFFWCLLTDIGCQFNCCHWQQTLCYWHESLDVGRHPFRAYRQTQWNCKIRSLRGCSLDPSSWSRISNLCQHLFPITLHSHEGVNWITMYSLAELFLGWQLCSANNWNINP